MYISEEDPLRNTSIYEEYQELSDKKKKKLIVLSIVLTKQKNKTPYPYLQCLVLRVVTKRVCTAWCHNRMVVDLNFHLAPASVSVIHICLAFCKTDAFCMHLRYTTLPVQIQHTAPKQKGFALSASLFVPSCVSH